MDVSGWERLLALHWREEWQVRTRERAEDGRRCELHPSLRWGHQCTEELKSSVIGRKGFQGCRGAAGPVPNRCWK